MDVTKLYGFIGFGAMDVTKPYGLIGCGAMDVTKPYGFMGCGAMDVTNRSVPTSARHGQPWWRPGSAAIGVKVARDPGTPVSHRPGAGPKWPGIGANVARERGQSGPGLDSSGAESGPKWLGSGAGPFHHGYVSFRNDVDDLNCSSGPYGGGRAIKCSSFKSVRFSCSPDVLP
jgi:hypothetical protein